MPITLSRRALALGALSLVALAACGSDDSSSAATAAATTTAAALATTTPSSAPADTTSADTTSASGATTGDSGAATVPADTAAPATDPAIDLSGVTLRVGDQVSLTQTGFEESGQGDTPYTIEWSTFTSGPPMLEALAADAIDIGGVGDAPPIFAAAGGAPLKVVLATKTPESGQGILIPADSTIADVAGLKGKKIAVAKGSSANWVLLKALQDNGLTVQDVDIAYLQPADAQTAFQSGDVDAWAIWDPYVTLSKSQGAKLLVSGEQLDIPGLGFQVTSDAALSDPAKVAAIRDFLTRVRASQAWARSNKDPWAAKYSELTKLPVDLAKQMLSIETQPALIDDDVIAAQQAEADAFFAAGVIPSAVTFSDFADGQFNDVTT